MLIGYTNYLVFILGSITTPIILQSRIEQNFANCENT